LLQRHGDVALALVGPDPISPEELDLTQKHFNLKAIMPLRATRLTAWNAIKKEIDPRFHAVRGQRLSPEDRKRFFDICNDHDIVWFHTVRIPDAAERHAWRNSILDVDDLPSQMYLSRAGTSASPLRWILDRRMVWLWRRREKLFLERFNAVCVCSDEDKSRLQGSERIHVVRNGFELKSGSAREKVASNAAPRLGFIGKLDFEPNQKGILWFTEKIWPSVKQAIPSARLRIVGSDSDAPLTLNGADIDRLGWVPDVDDEIASWSAMIIPIRQGGGTRIKIAEGFARRCPVVSTSLGAYGYKVKNREEAILADTPQLFSQACIDIIAGKALRGRLTENAFKKYSTYYTWEAQADSVERAIRHALTRADSCPV
jgi:glycosyltransferase involved in cell wall biosynthesis